ncbi:hypothetical protein [Salsuginibacillus kocurii]|uniref:hypothetical protein n=1 Tax=Salsuginibacillus kocurii TaxID=427078 RepID=UPI00037B0E49|nr:hypothetical protein [Salsuginibacillus kocurii]
MSRPPLNGKLKLQFEGLDADGEYCTILQSYVYVALDQSGNDLGQLSQSIANCSNLHLEHIDTFKEPS